MVSLYESLDKGKTSKKNPKIKKNKMKQNHTKRQQKIQTKIIKKYTKI